jgi:glycosyltransferase involved in cell wall biosynthesis
MRIGIDARSLYYSAGGIGRTTRALVRALTLQEGDETFIVFRSRKDSSAPFTKAPSNVRWASLWTPGHHRLEQWTLPLELALWQLDVLHCPDFIPPFRRRCPAVITVHDLAFLRWPEFLTADSRRYYNGQIARAVRSAEAIVAVSAWTKRDLVELLDVPQERVTVIHHGLEPFFRPQPEEATKAYRRTRGLPERFLLWLGVIEPRKNLGVLLRALAHLRDRGWKGPPLVCAGPRGWLWGDTLALVEALRLQEAVRFIGPVPLAELPQLYSSASAFLFPSLYEGFGLPPLEAMACGTPVVGSTTSSLPEVLGEAALYVDPLDVIGWAEAVQRVLEDEDLARDLRTRGIERAACFRWEDAAARYVELYRRVAA